MFSHLLPPDQIERKNKQFDCMGLDTLEKCFNKDWFLNFKDPVSYEFNSWGFRDYEQDQIENNCVAIGDSFTVGIGQPFHHIWPKQLELILKENVINLSSDGASNYWMLEILKVILPKKPKAIFIMLSFPHREMKILKNTIEHLHFDLSSIDELTIVTRSIEMYKLIRSLEEEHKIPIFLSGVPDRYLLNSMIQNGLNFVTYERFLKTPRKFDFNHSGSYLQKNDIARDAFHFGERTSLEIAQNFSKAFSEK